MEAADVVVVVLLTWRVQSSRVAVKGEMEVAVSSLRNSAGGH